VVVEVVEGSAADGHLELGDTVSAVDVSSPPGWSRPKSSNVR
jgi:hypothetical protein